MHRIFPKIKIISIFFLICLFFSLIKAGVLAQEEGPVNVTNTETKTYEALIQKIDEEKEIEIMGAKQLYQKLELTITNTEKKGQKITVINGNEPMANVIKYNLNDRVFVSESTDADGKKIFVITDFIRKDSIFLLVIIFTIATLIVARWKGFSSILGMIFTFWILFSFVLPKMLQGGNPVLIALIASIFIIPITFYLSHGLNKKTTVAILGSIISLLITSILAYIFIKLGHLTGLSSEEAGMLSLDKNGILNMKGILLAGIMIGALGVLDDITVSQAAVVSELSSTAKLTKVKDLYSKGMNIGRDHITSMVNTLILAYGGAALPLLLIFINNPHPFTEVINFEIVAEEIIKTLVGSIGLVLAVPITTIIAARWFKK